MGVLVEFQNSQLWKANLGVLLPVAQYSQTHGKAENKETRVSAT
jgi:hypothetical protein